MSDRLLASISFTSFPGDSSIPFNWGFFLWLPILSEYFSFFLGFWELCFANCLHGVILCGRGSVGVCCGLFDLLVWMLYGCSFFCLCGLSYTWALPVGSFFVAGFSPPLYLLLIITPTLSCMVLHRCCLTKQYYQTIIPTPAKESPYHISN